eukprot:m.231210 g.231210  ORF g.231210 m.231210 type:complete len:1066 (+) comp18280_c0_seq1:77-3274(+)
MLKRFKQARQPAPVAHPSSPVAPVRPPPDQLLAQLHLVLEDLNLPEAKQQLILQMPQEQQWQIVQSHQATVGRAEEKQHVSAEDYLTKIKATLELETEHASQERAEVLESLAVALRTQTLRFVLSFIDMMGLTLLLDLLYTQDNRQRGTAEHRNAIRCISSLMNNAYGLKCVLSHPNSLCIIAQSLDVENPHIRVPVLQILGAVCLVPGGHKKVLQAFDHLKKYAGERTRFQMLVGDLSRQTRTINADLELKTATMALINALVCAGPGRHSVVFRMHLRMELLQLGMLEIVDRLRQLENSALMNHIQIFEDVMLDDQDILTGASESSVGLECTTVSQVAAALEKAFTSTVGKANLLSIMQHLRILTVGSRTTRQLAKVLQVIDECVQQLVVQGDDGSNPDIDRFEINLLKIVQHYINDEDVVAAKQEKNKALASKDEYKARCRQAEEKLRDIKADKEAVQKALNKKIEKLQKSNAEDKETWEKLEAELKATSEKLTADMAAAEARIAELTAALVAAQAGGPVSGVLSPGVPPTPITPGLATPAPPAPPPPPTPMFSTGGPPPPPPPPPSMGGPPPPPPPPPMMGGPPPPGPPPPPGMPMFGVPAFSLPDKKTPASSVQLKSFNWTKVAPAKLKDKTVWSDMHDAEVYSSIDRTEFDAMFSAYQRKQTEDTKQDDDDEEHQRPKELSLVDGRRAQNCVILLTKLRMSNREIHHVVLSMDEDGRIPNDLIEIMLNFVPLPEEVAAMERLQEQIHMFAPADRFMWDMSRIPHYEQRLSSMVFRRKFPERVAAVLASIESVLNASNAVTSSKALTAVLELVLALGNYMNRGPRGNAHAFRIGSLLKIADTKSSKQKDFTLLHFLVQAIDSVPAFATIKSLPAELHAVTQACKVSLPDMTKDLSLLRQGMTMVSNELAWHAAQTNPLEGDLYPDVMDEFFKSAKKRMGEVEAKYQAMGKAFESAVKFVAEDPSETGPDEFFGTFDQFLARMAECRGDLVVFKRREEEERRKREAAAALQADKARKKGIGGKNTAAEPELDDLISTLRSGECFALDEGRDRRTRARRGGRA